MDLPCPGVGTGHDTAVTPQEQELVFDQWGRTKGSRAVEAVSLLRFPFFPGGAWSDGNHFLPHPQPAAGPEHQVPRDDGRADGRLDVAFFEDIGLPVLPAGVRVEAGDPVFVTGEDQFRRLAFGPVDARR